MAIQPLRLVLESVDRFSAGIRKMNHDIEGLTAPVRKVNRSFSLMGKELGFEKIGHAGEHLIERVRGVGEAFREVGMRAFEVIAGEGGLILLLKELASQATETAHQALKVGMSVEAYQGLAFGAREAHVDAEQLTIGLVRLNKATGEAAAGKKETAKIFAGLGISVRDAKGHIKGTDEILEKVADRLSRLHSRAAQTAFIIKLFGRSGMSLFPILEQGAAGIRAMRVEAEAMGAVLDEHTIRALEEFDVATRKLWGAAKGFAMTAVSGLMPAVNEVTEGLVEWTKANRDLIRTRVREYAALAGEKIRDLAEWVSKVWPKVQDAVEQFGGFERVLRFVGYGIGVWLVAPLATLGGSFGLLAAAVINFSAVLLSTPIGWVIAGIGLLGLAVYEIYEHWGPLKKWFAALWDGIVAGFREKIDEIRSLVSSMTSWMPSWLITGMGYMPGPVGFLGQGIAATRRSEQRGASGTWAAPAGSIAAASAKADVSGTVKLEIDLVNGTVRRKDHGERSGPLYFLVNPDAGLNMDPAWGS